MKRNFVQVAQFLDMKFPELKSNIVGEVYPVPPLNEFLGNIVSLFQFAGIAWMVLGGDKLLRMVGFRQLPSFYWTIQDNPVPFAIFLFLLAPQILAKFKNSGAFEIYLDGEVIFSKLSTGSLPTVDDLVNPLKAAGLKYVSDE